ALSPLSGNKYPTITLTTPFGLNRYVMPASISTTPLPHTRESASDAPMYATPPPSVIAGVRLYSTDEPTPHVPVGSPNVSFGIELGVPDGPGLPIVDRPRSHSPMYAPPPLNHPPPVHGIGSLSESAV